MYVDVGPVRPVGHKREAGGLAQRPVGRAVLRDLDLAKTLAKLHELRQGLTLGIPYVQIEEFPMQLRCHTIGVPSHWMRLLRMIAQAVTYYHEQH